MKKASELRSMTYNAKKRVAERIVKETMSKIEELCIKNANEGYLAARCETETMDREIANMVSDRIVNELIKLEDLGYTIFVDLDTTMAGRHTVVGVRWDNDVFEDRIGFDKIINHLYKTEIYKTEK